MAVTVVADAGRLGSASLTALNGGGWSPAERRAEPEAEFGNLGDNLDIGTLAIGLGVLALALYRPLARTLRRQEHQRRATALASTLRR